ncbi:MAG: hypothetical protein EHM12_08010 [Dehalococcoidia bacterium]|nr:MAG: hypothetical protein EHM12_08010 [Dehalococcoidia bacterium]
MESIVNININIGKSICIATPEMLKEKVKQLYDKDYPLLLSILPDISPASLNEDNVSDIDTFQLFILKPILRNNFNEEKEFSNWEETAKCCAEIKKKLRNDYFDRYQYPFLEGLNFKSIVQEIVWNMDGLMGWKLIIAMETEKLN